MSIAVLYEHQEWFTPLFKLLRQRNISYNLIDATALNWDPSTRPSFDLLVNRMSPSANLRGHKHAIHSVARFLEYVQSYKIPIINGPESYRLEISKSAQLDLFERLHIPYPKARIINAPNRVLEAARDLKFPVVIKPNIGGSGAGIQKYDTLTQLQSAVSDGDLNFGLDDTVLIQEFIPAKGGSIVRVELLNKSFVYAIKITPPHGFGFNLCPADICQDEAKTEKNGPIENASPAPLEANMCPQKPAMQIEATSVPDEIMNHAISIAESAKLDICGIEYLEDDRDGTIYFYDINALSNFVTDAKKIVGFDPFEKLVDYISYRYESRKRNYGSTPKYQHKSITPELVGVSD